MSGVLISAKGSYVRSGNDNASIDIMICILVVV